MPPARPVGRDTPPRLHAYRILPARSTLPSALGASHPRTAGYTGGRRGRRRSAQDYLRAAPTRFPFPPSPYTPCPPFPTAVAVCLHRRRRTFPPTYAPTHTRTLRTSIWNGSPHHVILPHTVGAVALGTHATRAAGAPHTPRVYDLPRIYGLRSRTDHVALDGWNRWVGAPPPLLRGTPSIYTHRTIWRLL